MADFKASFDINASWGHEGGREPDQEKHVEVMQCFKTSIFFGTLRD